MKKWIGLTLVAVVSSGSVYAEESCQVEKNRIAELENKIAELENAAQNPSSELERCFKVRDRKPSVGFKCRTVRGVVFERVSHPAFGNAWKAPNGVIWSDSLGKYAYRDGVQACELLGGHLPAIAFFRAGQAMGLDEILPVDFLWASPAVRFFLGQEGHVDEQWTAGVHCIAF